MTFVIRTFGFDSTFVIEMDAAFPRLAPRATILCDFALVFSGQNWFDKLLDFWANASRNMGDGCPSILPAGLATLFAVAIKHDEM
ncbi:hypothetical protein Enr8_38810 [Blastopirellula retiformator]|uniref:Uncharacterized protein n=1 Tax=Blastopirellula retiformator TaxID=2527970 RepID=A0A5C5V0T4_9BACT|nr:hypothetical protein Enr8_34420 [Blastopirellula retiformator]TWT31955.1 hypothetical protein Enr8_38810 [Blastopirellula retiformator]